MILNPKLKFLIVTAMHLVFLQDVSMPRGEQYGMKDILKNSLTKRLMATIIIYLGPSCSISLLYK